MEALPSYRRQHRWELLLKEIDQVHSTIKNLDDIIFRIKNFGFLFWGGSLYLIVQYLSDLPARIKMALIFLTGLIPVLFRVMDYNWRKHLLRCSRRERNISHFLNSKAFERLVLQGEKTLEGKNFPFFDVVGWTYTKTAEGKTDGSFLDEYLINPDEFRGWKIIQYKDAKWFYGTMFVVSIALGAVHLIVF
jgi:hypothetical protein